jgi:molybdate transport system substrate-binding protein
MQLHLLSGGAAAAVVEAVQPAFEVETGCKITGTYSAVGEMRDQLLKGQPCDLIILTGPLIDGLIASGHVLASSARSLGRVKTGIAVKSGTTHPAIATPEDLLKLLSRAQGIFFPDPAKATAGIHFMSVLKTLKLDVFKQAAFRPFPNGATAMRALAACSQPDLVGCTQATEINYTQGVDYVGDLPLAFELATNYTLGLCSGVEHPQLAQLLADWLAGPLTAEIRRAGGFEF